MNGNIDRRQDVRNLANNINCRGHIEPKARLISDLITGAASNSRDL